MKKKSVKKFDKKMFKNWVQKLIKKLSKSDHEKFKKLIDGYLKILNGINKNKIWGGCQK
jgi:hypothetical protein